jgi:hypothetical protein
MMKNYTTYSLIIPTDISVVGSYNRISTITITPLGYNFQI